MGHSVICCNEILLYVEVNQKQQADTVTRDQWLIILHITPSYVCRKENRSCHCKVRVRYFHISTNVSSVYIPKSINNYGPAKLRYCIRVRISLPILLYSKLMDQLENCRMESAVPAHCSYGRMYAVASRQGTQRLRRSSTNNIGPCQHEFEFRMTFFPANYSDYDYNGFPLFIPYCSLHCTAVLSARHTISFRSNTC